MSISYGTAASYEVADSNDGVQMARLSDTKFVVIYENDTNLGIEAKVGTVSGTNITFGPVFVVHTDSRENTMAIAALDSTHIIVCATISGSSGLYKIGTISGTNITWGSAAQFSTGDSRFFNNSVVAISSTVAVISYDNDSSGKGTSKVCTISGTNITYGSEDTWHSGSNGPDGTITALSATKLVVAINGGDNSDVYLVAGDLNGTSISWGTSALAKSIAPLFNFSTPGITAISSTKCIFSWALTGNFGEARVATISGPTSPLALSISLSRPFGLPLMSSQSWIQPTWHWHGRTRVPDRVPSWLRSQEPRSHTVQR